MEATDSEPSLTTRESVLAVVRGLVLAASTGLAFVIGMQILRLHTLGYQQAGSLAFAVSSLGAFVLATRARADAAEARLVGAAIAAVGGAGAGYVAGKWFMQVARREATTSTVLAGVAASLAVLAWGYPAARPIGRSVRSAGVVVLVATALAIGAHAAWTSARVSTGQTSVDEVGLGPWYSIGLDRRGWGNTGFIRGGLAWAIMGGAVAIARRIDQQAPPEV